MAGIRLKRGHRWVCRGPRACCRGSGLRGHPQPHDRRDLGLLHERQPSRPAGDRHSQDRQVPDRYDRAQLESEGGAGPAGPGENRVTVTSGPKNVPTYFDTASPNNGRVTLVTAQITITGTGPQMLELAGATGNSFFELNGPKLPVLTPCGQLATFSASSGTSPLKGPEASQMWERKQQVPHTQ